jgi:hypothetical protein
MRTIGGLLREQTDGNWARESLPRVLDHLREKLSALAPRTNLLKHEVQVQVQLAYIHRAARLANSYISEARTDTDMAWGRAKALLEDALLSCGILERTVAELEHSPRTYSPSEGLRRAATAMVLSGVPLSLPEFLIGVEVTAEVREELGRGAGVASEDLAAWWASPVRTAGERLLAVDRAILALKRKAQ